MRCSLAVLVLAGCFSKPSPPCTAAVALPFTTNDNCAPWGMARGNGDVHQDNGVLVITPSQNQTMECDQNASTPFTEGGVFVEVEPDGDAFAQTAFSIGVPGLDNPQIDVRDGTITVAQVGNPNAAFDHRPYDHDAMHWWRFIPGPLEQGLHGVIAQVSPDGRTWTDLVRIAATDLPADDQSLGAVNIELATSNGDTTGHAEFRSGDICPDD